MTTVRPSRPSLDDGVRSFDRPAFRDAWDRVVVEGTFQETRDYYRRYRSRYEHVLREYAAVTGSQSVDVCEIGGGQHALIAQTLWGDHATVGDLGGPHLAYLASHGVRTLRWDLTQDEVPFEEAFDRLFLCEVIAHVTIPPHVYLDRLRRALRPGGRIIVSTPNLQRLRNVAYLTLGKDPWGYFAKTSGDHFFGMFLDFSCDHLAWQLETAGFHDVRTELVDYPHRATTLGGRVGNALGRPLRSIPRFRAGIVATATA